MAIIQIWKKAHRHINTDYCSNITNCITFNVRNRNRERDSPISHIMYSNAPTVPIENLEMQTLMEKTPIANNCNNETPLRRSAKLSKLKT